MAAKSKLDFVFNGVDNTKKAFNSIGRGLDKTAKFAKTTSKAILGITATATAAAGTLAYFAKRNIDTLDTLGKTASKLGVNVEFLQKMRFAAEQTGIETRTLDMGLQRFIRRVAEAAIGHRSESTRLNSSHTVISYAVFCLKKKNETKKTKKQNKKKIKIRNER